jgi:hypothetical protein
VAGAVAIALATVFAAGSPAVAQEVEPTTTVPPLETSTSPTTESPATLPPPTEAPTTAAPVTEVPTTLESTTVASTTEAPTTVAPTIPEGQLGGEESPPTGAVAPTTTIAEQEATCSSAAPKNYAEFDGIAGEHGRARVRFAVTKVHVGAVGGSAEVEFPDHAGFIDAHQKYRVRAWSSEGRTVSYLTSDDCGRPYTTLSDGRAVPTALMSPFRRQLPKVLIGTVLMLGAVMLVVRMLGQARVISIEEPLLVDDRDTYRAFRARGPLATLRAKLARWLKSRFARHPRPASN